MRAVKRAAKAKAKAKAANSGTRDAMGRSNSKVWYNGEWVDPVVAAAQADAKHQGLRTYLDHEIPAYLERVSWPEVSTTAAAVSPAALSSSSQQQQRQQRRRRRQQQQQQRPL